MRREELKDLLVTCLVIGTALALLITACTVVAVAQQEPEPLPGPADPAPVPAAYCQPVVAHVNGTNLSLEKCYDPETGATCYLWRYSVSCVVTGEEGK